MTTRRGGATAVLLAALLLAGCAGSGAPTAGGGASASPTVAVDPADPLGKTAPVPDPADPQPGTTFTVPSPGGKPGGKPGAAGTQTLTGTISDGVEPHCLMLTSGDGVHQLIIADDAARAVARAGASVTVVGRADPRMMTTCQQGTPFVVTEMRAN